MLGLVSNAWAGFGAAFGPLILLALTWRGMTGTGAVAGLLIGAAVVAFWILWTFEPGSSMFNWIVEQRGLDPKDFAETGVTMSNWVYEMVPGFAAAMIAIVAVSKATAKTETA